MLDLPHGAFEKLCMTSYKVDTILGTDEDFWKSQFTFELLSQFVILTLLFDL